jgi:hypothetical protein
MWENARPGHSAVPFPGRPYVFETDEVYGTYFVPTYGCPWGWALILDVTDPERPSIVSEYKVRENTQEFCDSPENTPETNHLNTYTAHNPTLTRNLALVTWSSAGLQAIDIKDPFQSASGRLVLAGPSHGGCKRGSCDDGRAEQGHDVELPHHLGRADLRNRYSQRAVHPPLYGAPPRVDRQDRLPRRKLQPQQRAGLGHEVKDDCKNGG